MTEYEYRHQPLKALYLAYQLVTTVCVRFPLWTLAALPRALRPRASWTVSRTLRVRLLRHLIHLGGKIGVTRKIPDHLAIAPGVGVKGIWVNPRPELVQGAVKEWADAAGVSTVRLPGYWLDKKGDDIAPGAPYTPGEKVLYALHGGAYVRLSAHPSDPTAFIAKGLLEHCAPIRRAFSLEYRLSAGAPFDAAHPFPTALVDALMGYAYLLRDVGVPPADVVLEGDSAGGNLALALTRYLRDTPGCGLALPGALLLNSPWSDLGPSHVGARSSVQTNFASDYLGLPPYIPGGAPTAGYAVRAFLGPHPTSFAKENAYISPASNDVPADGLFKGFPKTLVTCGGAEQLADMIRALVGRMERDMGDGWVVYHEAPDGVHDYTTFVWHEPERTETFVRIANWVDEL